MLTLAPSATAAGYGYGSYAPVGVTDLLVPKLLMLLDQLNH